MLNNVFPFLLQNPDRRMKWNQSIGFALSDSDYICEFHFSKKDVIKEDKTETEHQYDVVRSNTTKAELEV